MKAKSKARSLVRYYKRVLNKKITIKMAQQLLIEEDQNKMTDKIINDWHGYRTFLPSDMTIRNGRVTRWSKSSPLFMS